ncbi:MAG: 4-hydroxy-tetrahydrodipicolinate synthase [Anaeroplasma sp.]
MIKGSIVALVTPFDENNHVDYNAIDKMIDLQIKAKTDGLLLLGTTAEAESLTEEEKNSLVKYIYQKVYPKIHIIVGLISNNRDDVIKQSLNYKDLMIDSYLVIAPFYIKTNESGLLKYFTYIADHLDKPVILYNVPKRTGMEISKDVIVALSYHKNIIGVKDASGSLILQQEIMMEAKEDFLYYCGDDFVLLPSVNIGADGIISVIGNAFPNEIKRLMLKDLNIYDYKRIFQICKSMYSEVSPIGIKYVLYLLGYIKLFYRSPLDEPSKHLKRNIEKTIIDIYKEE